MHNAAQKRPRVVVVGGGIAGLSAAHRLHELAQLQRRPIELILLEASNRVGGVISTYVSDELILESGPDSFITQKPWALNLCHRLGLSHRLIKTNPEHRRTYVASGNKIHPLPDGFLMMAPTRWEPFLMSPLFSWGGKLRMALDMVLPAQKYLQDESLADFVRRRLGQEALERIAQPMVSGIYTADPEKLSLEATMPRFLELERKYGSIIRGLQAEANQPSQSAKNDAGPRYSLFVSLDQGMQVLVDGILQKLPAGCIKLNSPVQYLLAENNQPGWNLHLNDGSSLHADAVVLATPAHHSARLLQVLDRDVSSELLGIPYASAAVLSLIYRRQDIPHALDGFGFVVPAMEQRSILACTFSSVKFVNRAPDQQVILRLFMGGALQPDIYRLGDADLEMRARQDLQAYLGITMPPLAASLSRHPLSMPQYHVGHKQRIQRIDAGLKRMPGLSLAGNAYHGVGIPDCINSGQQAADNIFQYLSTVISSCQEALNLTR